jgi:glycine cleavage system aminomethyltransferase T
LAIQGPKAVDVTAALFGDHIRDFRYFGFEETSLDGIPLVLARSGWSKQGGYELYLMDGSQGTRLWDLVKAAGAAYGIGPGAPNDTERLESGLISYGSDMRLQSYRANPYEMGMGALVDLTSAYDFVGRAALERIAAQPVTRSRAGLVLEGNPAAPGHAVPLIHQGQAVGHVTEMVYSKRLGKTIAVGLCQADLAAGAAPVQIALPDGLHTAHFTAIPFVK